MTRRIPVGQKIVRNLSRKQLRALQQAMSEMAKPAREAGRVTFPMGFWLAADLGPDGLMRPTLLTAMRYTTEAIARDREAIPEGIPASWTVIVWSFDPATPEGEAEIALHRACFELELAENAQAASPGLQAGMQ